MFLVNIEIYDILKFAPPGYTMGAGAVLRVRDFLRRVYEDCEGR
jgi:hypothetical protein